jgi:indolepyruvate ferredoxin oxidoreductase beta subunit
MYSNGQKKKEMKKDIILSGVGGQGILTIASVIGLAAMNSGLQLKQSEVHGMSQRGGDVQSHLRISDGTVFSDLIPMGECDIIISIEPMESLRYIPWLSKEGWIITNAVPFENISGYPPMSAIISELEKIENHIIIDAEGIASKINSPRSGNIVVLGAASSYLGIISSDSLENAIISFFSNKGEEIVEKNILAFNEGKRISEAIIKSKK